MSKLFVRQKGAGNGKTYDAILLLNNKDEYRGVPRLIYEPLVVDEDNK